MPRFAATFPVAGPLAGNFAVIDAVDEHTARLALIGVYGRSGWAGIYRIEGFYEQITRYGLVEVEFGTLRETAQDYSA